VENINNAVNISFVVKTSDINFFQNIRSDVETTEMATLNCMHSERWIPVRRNYAVEWKRSRKFRNSSYLKAL